MPARATSLAAAMLLLAAAACAGSDAVSAPGPRGNELVTEGGGAAAATHAVRGLVLGVDSAGSAERYTPVARASVRVVQLVRAPLPPGADTSAAPTTRTVLGTVTSDASGVFQLAPVPDGYFALEVTPPAGSPYGGGTAYSISFAPGDQARALVYLYPR